MVDKINNYTQSNFFHRGIFLHTMFLQTYVGYTIYNYTGTIKHIKLQ